MWVKRGLAGALATLALVAACGSGDDSEEASSGSSEGNGGSTTTTAAAAADAESTTTTVAAVGPTEWVEVVNDLVRRLEDLGANPDPARVRDVVAEECDCYQRYYDTTVAIADEGQRVVADPGQVFFVKVEQEYEDGSVRLTSQGQPGAGQLVDRNGDVLDEFPAGERNCTSQLVKPDGPGGSYRIHDEVYLDSCPPEAEA